MKFVTLNYLLIFSLSFTFQQSVVAQQSCRTRDSLALVDLYNATGGANWTRRDNWLTNSPINTWYGVKVTSSGCVQVIDLDGSANFTIDYNTSGNNLNGTIPNSIGDFADLEYLFLQRGKLTGTIPSTIGNLGKLQILTLFVNKLTGSIPSTISSASNLSLLELSSNQLSGTIPTSIGSMSKLFEISLGSNMLTGSIPTSFGNLATLNKLIISNNQLSGTIPSELGNLINLGTFYAPINQFSGQLPSTLGQLTNLTDLSLWDNRLTGTIPVELGNLTKLTRLSLSSNRLTGTIPTTLGNLTNLIEINLNYNYLTGTIPTSFSNYKKLWYLNLNNNQLSGIFPVGIGNDTSMIGINITNNQISGSLPDLSSMKNLINFYADSNRLTGSVPSSLVALPKLTILGLRNNLLTGSFPTVTSPLLTDIVINNNDIDSVVTMPASLTAIGVFGNKLTFDDIIPNISKYNASRSYYTTFNGTFIYAPQDSFFVDTTIIATIAPPLSINLKIDGALTTNSYKWYKNGVLQSAYTSNRNKLTINSLQATDAGVWTCQVTNPAAPNLTLYSRKITIQFNSRTITGVVSELCTGNPLVGASVLIKGTTSGTVTDIDGKYSLSVSSANDTLVFSYVGLTSITKSIGSQTTINVSFRNYVGSSQTLNPTLCMGSTYRSPSGKFYIATGVYKDTVKTIGGCDSILYTINLTILPPTNAGALKFEGIFSNTSVELGSWFNYQVFSVEMWVKPGATQVNYADIIDNKHSTSINWLCQQNGSETNTYYLGARDNIVIFKLTADKWQHLALIKDSTRMSVYINGILVDTAYEPRPINYDGNQFVTLGRHGWGGRNWSGEMDEVRLWSRALCQTEIQARLNCELSGTQNGLLAYYKFNQGTVACDNTSETVLKDETGQHNGTLKNFSLKDTITNYTLGKVTGTCSNNVSSGLSTFYRDADGDSFGDRTYRIQACDRPSGYVSDSTDCNDNDVLAHITAQPPTVSNITYCQNAAASPLRVTGTNLRWYIALSGGVGDSIVPIPTTSTIGTKSYFVTQSNGCESSRAEIKVTIYSPNATNLTLNPLSCTQYTAPSGKIINTTGNYRDTVKTVGGCDSIRYTINLTVQNTVTTQTINPSVCTTYKSPSGKILRVTGIYQDTLKTTKGCDSIRYTINLTIFPTATLQTLTPSVCFGQIYRSPSGKTFTTAGLKLDTLKNRSGCDSIYFSINLTILNPQNQQAATQSVCKGDVFRGKILTRDTVFRDTIRSIALCDSVILTTRIKVYIASVNNLNLSLCAGGSATVNGIVYNVGNRSGQQILRAASAAGCDSIINITTSFVNNLSAVDDEYTVRDSSNVLNFNVLDNDFISGNVVTVTPLSKPLIGRLDTLGVGRFRYSFPPQANGTAGFSYRLCSTVCPNLCDTAVVKIIINRPRLNQDVSLGITPNCGCPNEKLLFPELVLNPDKYPANELTVVSRWGDVVFRAKPYKNDWSGANDTGQVLPAGTYYYIMRLDLANSLIKTGDITIYR